jgi:hypothetical protein
MPWLSVLRDTTNLFVLDSTLAPGIGTDSVWTCRRYVVMSRDGAAEKSHTPKCGGVRGPMAVFLARRRMMNRLIRAEFHPPLALKGVKKTLDTAQNEDLM